MDNLAYEGLINLGGELLTKAIKIIDNLVETAYEARDHHTTEEWLALRNAEAFLVELGE